MNHIFVINPVAGKRDVSNEIISRLKALEKKITYKIYITSRPKDAYEYVKDVCNNLTEDVVFYACGGDGTLNEVVSGVVGCPYASVACFPSGSGNDFIKVFGTKDDFMDLEGLIDGVKVPIDVIQANDDYSVNIGNIGFDAFVASQMIKFKNKPLVNGRTAYSLALFYSLMFRMKTKCTIVVDGVKLPHDRILLASFANGICYGGGYYCAPRAKVNDGLLEVCVVKPLSRFKFISMVKKYKKGLHLDDPKTKKLITYLRGKEIHITSDEDIIYCLDGEVACSKDIRIRVRENAVNFVIPKKLS